jgi:hypothetical protein
MKNMIARWLIGRSIDNEQPLSAWVQRQLQRDESLVAYAAQCRRLIGRLRADADVWVDQQSGQAVRPAGLVVTSVPGRARGAAAATLIALVVTLLLVFRLPDPVSTESRVGTTGHPTAATDSDVRVVADFVQSQTSLASRLLRQARQAGADTIASLRPRPLSAARWMAGHAQNAVEGSGRTVGRTMSLLNSGMKAEQQQLWNVLQPVMSGLERLQSGGGPDADDPASETH